MRQKYFLGGFVICLMSLFFLSQNVSAVSEDAVEKLVSEASQELVCLCGCGNMILNTCTCGIANEWRDFLRAKIREGNGKEQLLQIMAQKHGPQVLAAPAKEGLNWVLWVVVPYILPIVAAVFVGVMLVRWVRRRNAPAAAAEEIKSEDKQKLSEYEKRLEKELKDFDK